MNVSCGWILSQISIPRGNEASNDFVSDERIVWVDIEGVSLHALSCETFSRIGKKWGETLNIERIVLGVLEEVIRVGQAMGFSMEGCEKDVENIIKNQGDETVFK
nr:UvrD-like helicase, ATP-binding domain, P-loop containing nucleoside triphosphate hydrolase [Tanacetum cinerariifolium]